MSTETKNLPVYIECGCCGGIHREEYHGDCRNDSECMDIDEIESMVEAGECEYLDLDTQMWMQAYEAGFDAGVEFDGDEAFEEAFLEGWKHAREEAAANRRLAEDTEEVRELTADPVGELHANDHPERHTVANKSRNAACVPPPSCEHCGKPATRIANLAIDVHYFKIAEEDWYDGDCLVDIRDVYICDRCDAGVKIPKKELQRLGTYCVPVGEEE